MNKPALREFYLNERKSLSQSEFVLLLAFDKSGHPVGYGDGFYDRFLAQCKSDTIKTGLSITQPALAAIEANSFDIALDYCINHKKLYDFSA